MLFVPPVSLETVQLDSFFRRRHTKGLTQRETGTEEKKGHTHRTT